MSLLKLKEMQQDLSKKELLVASYILNNAETIKTISIHSLAEATKVSTATILRLCDKLGYSGFSDFKIALIASPNTTQSKLYLQDDIKVSDSMEEINAKVFQMEKLAIDATYSMIDTATLNQAVDMLIKCNKVVIYGAASSSLIGKELEYQLIKLKKNVSCNFDYYVQHNILGTLDKDDVLIIFSNSGETSLCIKLLEYSKKLNVPSIAITRLGHSKVSSLASIVLHTSSEETSRLIPIRSKVSQLSIINILVANIFVRQYEENFERLSALVSSPNYLKTQNNF
ncbi:MurR/RpiR family transcriptional regulator [Zophobihabitans entericus]|uniref:MurR/RpiR family transcriptional regulator n=1 Tax=Zophobihabitans entericus TaxID=1635327 RepID=A0A6G9ICK1_9GAMM|nr:MurR/RpiR family transcriptional regulator [Zophobihabitans entericus]QIQ21567.1 MurR/RpiR family transcriptional regulator [Zophobihabitans entericus]